MAIITYGTLLRTGLVTVVAAVAVGLLGTSTLAPDTESVRLHQVLSTFREEGQLFIETFAPLSYFFAGFSAHALTCVEAGCRIVAASALLARLELCSGHTSLPLVVVCLVSLPHSLWINVSCHEANALSTSQTLGNTLSLLAFLSCWSLRPSRLWRALQGMGGIEAVIVIALCLGTHGSDSVFCLGVVTLTNISNFLANIADRSRRVTISTLTHVYRYFQRMAIVLGTFVVIFSVTFPLQETAAGGNYNLRYLPAQLRRDLRPSIPNYHPGLAKVNDLQLSFHGLVPAAPVSLYVPHAGFLWTDPFTWDVFSSDFRSSADKGNSTGLRGLHSNEADVEHLMEEQERILFSDQFNIVGPWFFQQAANEMANKTDELVSSRVWPGQTVYLRHYETGAFVTAVEKASLTSLYGHTDDDIRRLHVSTTTNVSSGSKWQIQYDPVKDEGFRLWNRKNGCFLATSYRTFPNFYGQESNDSVLHTLNLELEACCTDFPNKAASTFYAVDGVKKPLPPLTLLPRSFGQLALVEMRVRGYWMYARAILRAMIDLAHFRHHHATLQATPPELLTLHSSTRPSNVWDIMFLMMLSSFLLLAIGQVLYAQRSADKNKNMVTYRIGRTMPLIWCFGSFLVRGGSLKNNQFVVGLGLSNVVDMLNDLLDI